MQFELFSSVQEGVLSKTSQINSIFSYFLGFMVRVAPNVKNLWEGILRIFEKVHALVMPHKHELTSVVYFFIVSILCSILLYP